MGLKRFYRNKVKKAAKSVSRVPSSLMKTATRSVAQVVEAAVPDNLQVNLLGGVGTSGCSEEA